MTGVEKLRFFWSRRVYKKSNMLFLRDNPGIEIPPDFFLYETYMLSYEFYYNDGLDTAKEIIDLLEKRYSILQKGLKYLDWGCGPARVVRHLPDLLPEAELHAVDYNSAYVEWCRSKIKGIRFEQASVSPPTLYSGSYFDVITGLSVFTHLSGLNHYAWIEELHRIIKPEGMLLITTQGQSYKYKLSARERRKFNEGKLVVRDSVLEGNRLFSAFHPLSFIQLLIKNKFEIVEFISGREGSKPPEQDKWILKKTCN